MGKACGEKGRGGRGRRGWDEGDEGGGWTGGEALAGKGRRSRFEAEACAAELLDAMGRLGIAVHPPVPVDRIAGALGFRVVPLQGVHDLVCALVSVRDRVIGLNARHSRERQRFSLAHELGHIMLGHGQRPDELVRLEMEADAFAAALIIPGPWLEKERVRPQFSVESAAMACGVSQDAMRVRLAHYKVLPDCDSQSGGNTRGDSRTSTT